MRFAICAVVALILTPPGWADQVQLKNGDTIRGKVLKLDEQNLHLDSESLGELKIARDKIAVLYFGDAVSAKPVTKGESGDSPQALIEKFIGKSGDKPASLKNSPDDLVQQLKSNGLDPAAIGEVQKMFPLLATPEAGGYFKDTLGGLMSGKLNVQDIRKDAIKAREMIDDLRKELGPQADALNGYRSILDKFINETEPPKKK